MRVSKLSTGVRVLHYNSFGSQRMKVENSYLKKYKLCNQSIKEK